MKVSFKKASKELSIGQNRFLSKTRRQLFVKLYSCISNIGLKSLNKFNWDGLFWIMLVPISLKAKKVCDLPVPVTGKFKNHDIHILPVIADV